MATADSRPVSAPARRLTARTLALGAAGIVLLALPWAVARNDLFLAIQIVVLALFAASFNLLFGYTGLVSFGQAAFFGVGAYTYALLLKRVDVPFPPGGAGRAPGRGAGGGGGGLVLCTLHPALFFAADAGFRPVAVGRGL
jgi:ABC-type branched-subunit amino acid transport system permease subunit